jgi:hypothetical protein
MKAASEFSAGSGPPRVSTLSQSERCADGDDRPGKPQREEHQGETVIQPGERTILPNSIVRDCHSPTTIVDRPEARLPRTSVLLIFRTSGCSVGSSPWPHHGCRLHSGDHRCVETLTRSACLCSATARRERALVFYWSFYRPERPSPHPGVLKRNETPLPYLTEAEVADLQNRCGVAAPRSVGSTPAPLRCW